VANDTVLLLGLGAVFVALLVLFMAIGSATVERQQVNRSLAAIRAIQTSGGARRTELDRPFWDRVVNPGMRRLSRLGRSFTPTDQSSRIRRRLDLAGSPPEWDVDRVVAFKMLGLFLGVFLGALGGLLLGRGGAVVVGLGVAAAIAGYFAPSVVLYQLAYERTERIRRTLPDALDLLSISVEAGLSFDAALAQVARKTTGPVADEFFRVLQEMQIGLGRADAMRALGDRTDLPELRTFVTAMVQAESFGIPVASVLRIQSREMRVRRTQRAEELAQKVPVKILFPLIFCILPSLFIVILGPAAISILDSFVIG